MVFKGRFFSSSKRSDSSDGSNSSPKTPSTASTRAGGGTTLIDSPDSRSDKKKPKSSKEGKQSGGSSGCQTPVKDVVAAGAAVRRQQQRQQSSQEKDDRRRGEEVTSVSSSSPGTANKGGVEQRPSTKLKGKDVAGSTSNISELPSAKDGATMAGLAPIVASSLRLNRIKTRSGPLPTMEGVRDLGRSNLSRDAPSSSSTSTTNAASDAAKGVLLASSKSGRGGDGNGKKKGAGATAMDSEISHDQGHIDRLCAIGTGIHKETTVAQVGPSSSCDKEATPIAQQFCSWTSLQAVGDVDVFPQCPFDDCVTPKESESPRFKAIMDATSVPKKRHPGDIKSFSHELNSKGVRPYPFWKPRGINNLKEVLKIIQLKFEKAKEEVNSDLAVFAGELVGIMEKNTDTHPDWKETLEDLLLLARSCVVTSPGDFWLQCEGIVQDLDDRRQELPMGVLKKLHTRMLFILTRCTRLLQFHKESGFADDELVLSNHQTKMLHFSEERPLGKGRVECIEPIKNQSISRSTRKSYSQEQHIMNCRKSHEIKPVNFLSCGVDTMKPSATCVVREKISSWKPLHPRGQNAERDSVLTIDASEQIEHSFQANFKGKDNFTSVIVASNASESAYSKDPESLASKHQHKGSWGYWGDPQNFSDDTLIMCRICEEYVPTYHVEDHLKVCTVSDRCDQKGLNVDERLIRIAETLEKLVERSSQLETQHSNCSPDNVKVHSSVTEESDVASPTLCDLPCRGSTDMLDYFQDGDNSVSMDDLKGFPIMMCKTRFGPKSDHGMATSSAGSMTPRSPLLTPRTSHIDSILAGKSLFAETNDLSQIKELADIARCIASTAIDDEQSLPYMVSCLEDLQEVIDRRKHEALTVQTFGARIEKLHREKYLQLCDAIDVEKVDVTSTVMDEEDDVVRSLRNSPVHASMRDRTSIDDFEIIKPISRGAFGRVFLAKKRTTGDLFAIKVLKKSDMIRKNAVESILAERNILITVRNPFVVRFFYSFTSRENLYLVMEYLNGGDLYSLLRNLGCLDEEVARIYIAEVVLALEYLHSLRVVHRDLKPDNLLIAHDGHIKLTDFGLSKVGLINSTDDLSGPTTSDTYLMVEDEPQLSLSENQLERRKKRSAVGTPDYLAPEILLGTGHGASADWWSVGVILYELIVGIPPFNAEHPQTIFDNILNRKIPWPRIPEEMSFEAHDLIDKLLTEDPNLRLGARGASEVKHHAFFKDINWDTLARQKAAFVPSSDSMLDTSYFTSRYSWNPSDERIYEASEFEDSSDNESATGSSCVSKQHDESADDCGGFAEMESATSVNYSFSNFSFKNLSQLASINYDLLSKGWKEESHGNSGT